MILFLLRSYQKYISPALPDNKCRYYPTCSCYAVEAITKYGTIKGVFISLKRLLRCHPLHPGGYDPVP